MLRARQVALGSCLADEKGPRRKLLRGPYACANHREAEEDDRGSLLRGVGNIPRQIMSGMSRMGMRDGGRREDDERRQGAKKPVNNHHKTGDDAAARGNPKSASAGFRVAFRLRLTRPRTMLSDRPPRIAHPSGQTPAVLARERGIKLITLRAAFFRRRAETEQRPDAGTFEPARIVGVSGAVGAETLGAMVAIGAAIPIFMTAGDTDLRKGCNGLFALVRARRERANNSSRLGIAASHALHAPASPH